MNALARRYWFWFALAVAAAAYFPRFLSPGGLEIYLPAAQCLLDQKVLQVCNRLFTYPPTFAFFSIPFVYMPAWLTALVWYVATIAACVQSYRLSERLGAELFKDSFTETELVWVRVIAGILILKFVLAVLENQAHDAFPLFFIVYGLVLLRQDRELGAGALLGLAAAMKATPLVFLPYLLIRRRFSAGAAFLAVFALVSYAPDLFFTPRDAAHGYFHTWILEVAGASLGLDPHLAKLTFWSGSNPLNHSLRGMVQLQFDARSYPALSKWLSVGLDLAFIAWAAALLLWRRSRTDMIGIDGSILLVSMLMLSPMTSRSHYVVLLLPYTVLTMVMLRDQATGRLGAALMALSYLFLTATSNDLVGKTVSDFAYFHSFLVIGVLVLMVYISIVVWNPATLGGAKPFVWKRATSASRVPS